MSKHPSHKEKVKSQENKAKRRVALGFGDQCHGIWANGVTFGSTLWKTHLGYDPIYKTQKWFAENTSGLSQNIFWFFMFRVLR